MGFGSTLVGPRPTRPNKNDNTGIYFYQLDLPMQSHVAGFMMLLPLFTQRIHKASHCDLCSL